MTDDKSVRMASTNWADQGRKDNTGAISRFGNGSENNRCRRKACEKKRQPTKVPTFSMIATGLALLIVHSLIVIVLAALGGVGVVAAGVYFWQKEKRMK